MGGWDCEGASLAWWLLAWGFEHAADGTQDGFGGIDALVTMATKRGDASDKWWVKVSCMSCPVGLQLPKGDAWIFFAVLDV